jgi:glycosyltransferase involved in cell wall biosynthesis
MINPLMSVITVCYNSEKYIENTIESVINQTYKNIEYIIIDGGSNDKTLDIIEKYKDKITKIVSESDKGIYDAMNKGLKLASGDIIGFLNSDDFYYDKSVVEQIVKNFDINTDLVFSDIVIVDSRYRDKITRVYNGDVFKPSRFRFGIMPPHPSCYIRKKCFEMYGNFKTDFMISGDFDLLVRFIWKNKINIKYVPKTWIKMREGGVGDRISNKLKVAKELMRGCIENGINTNYFLINLRYFIKLNQLFKRV